MMCRKECKECPYKVKNDHNGKFVQRFNKLQDKGIIGGTHTCHMISPGWSSPTNENVCIGSLKQQRKK